MVRLIALYNPPEDPEAFDSHYRDVHAPIVQRYPKIRDLRLTTLEGVAGRESPYHLMAEMSFDSEGDLTDALESQPAAESARDLRNFASSGVTLFIARDAAFDDAAS